MQIRQELADDGVRGEDEISIQPLFGHKKTIRLLFTEVEITSNRSYDPPVIEGAKWVFPSIQLEEFKVTLKLDQEFNCYYLSSKHFFKVSGQWTQKTFLKRGDCLQLFGNRIYFLGRSKVDLKNDGYYPVGRKLNVLLEGETGTGKSSLAKRIHLESGLKGSFCHLNLASYSAGLIESELFGHIKGAFTGAVNDKKGAIESSKEGTLFLDEIDSLSLETQTKLLTYLDEGEFRRVGSAQILKVKPRFIFASGQNLKSLVQSGRMRKDFYYRVSSGVILSLKPLRSERGKIERVLCAFEKENFVRISKNLRTFYRKFNWPGNYRQLQGHLEKKIELVKSPYWEFDHVDEALLSDISLVPEGIDSLGLEQLEYEYVEKTYQKLSGDERSTCKILSISKYRLRKILERAS